MAANSTLFGGFINPVGEANVTPPEDMLTVEIRLVDTDPLAEPFGITNPYDEEAEGLDKELATRTAYIPEELREKVGGATGIFVEGLHGNILGPQDSQNIIITE